MNNPDWLSPRLLIPIVFLATLLLFAYWVLEPFLASLAWAFILCYATWPLYIRFCDKLGHQSRLAALLMTTLLAALFIVPVVLAINSIRKDLPGVLRALRSVLEQGSNALPERLLNLPWVGDYLRNFSDQLATDQEAVIVQMLNFAEPWMGNIVGILGDFGLNTFKFSFAMLTAFFIYRHGESLLAQARQVSLGFLGERSRVYLKAIADTTRAVLYGLVLTALAQGALAGIGYWAAGLTAPVLLGFISAVFALIPFGTPLIWVTASIWLLLNDQIVAGTGLLIYGAAVVSQIDNLLRPMLISSATQIPFLLVLFGVLGGIGAFGLVGLFLGPIIIAMLLAVWREWLDEHTAAKPGI